MTGLDARGDMPRPTQKIEIDLSVSPPSVVVDGVQVGVRLSVTYHKAGGLQVQSLTIKNVPDGRTIQEARDAA